MGDAVKAGFLNVVGVGFVQAGMLVSAKHSVACLEDAPGLPVPGAFFNDFKAEDAPDKEARIEYPEDAERVADASQTTIYEMQAPTPYDTHVEMYGEVVIN